MRTVVPVATAAAATVTASNVQRTRSTKKRQLQWRRKNTQKLFKKFTEQK